MHLVTKDILRTLAGAPLILFLYAMAQNEYLFTPLVLAAGLVLVAGTGVAWRFFKKQRAHTAFWLIVFLCLYNAPMVIGGYVFIGGWILFFAPFSFAAGFWAIHRRHIVLRLGMAVIFASFFGILSLHFHRNLDFDHTLKRCERQEAKLDPLVEVVDRTKHPYDFGIVSGQSSDEYLIAAYGLDDRLRVYAGSTGEFVEEIRLPREGEVQRLLPAPGFAGLYAVPWGRRGLSEEIYRVDVDKGEVVGALRIAGEPGLREDAGLKDDKCRNVFEAVVDGDAMFVLCEVSHSLVKVDLHGKRAKQYLKLPGRDAYDMVFDPVKRRIFTTDYWSPDVVVIDADDFKVESLVHAGWSTFGVVLHERALFVARPLACEVVEIDADTLKIVSRIDVGYGVRDLEVDAGRQVLFAGNYFDGTVDAIDAKTGAKTVRVLYRRL